MKVLSVLEGPYGEKSNWHISLTWCANCFICRQGLCDTRHQVICTDMYIYWRFYCTRTCHLYWAVVKTVDYIPVMSPTWPSLALVLHGISSHLAISTKPLLVTSYQSLFFQILETSSSTVSKCENFDPLKRGFYSTPSTEGVESTRGNSVCLSVCLSVCP